METFLNIHCQQTSPNKATEDCLKQLASIPKDYNFAFIYVTDTMAVAFPDLIKQCKSTTGIEHWVGTIGLGIVASNTEYYDQPAVSILLANFDEDSFNMLPLVQSKSEIESFAASQNFSSSFGVVHGDPFHPQTQDSIEEIHLLINHCFLVGGLTSASNQQFQVADNVFSEGVSGVLFSDEVPVLTNLSQGCSPISKKQTISSGRSNEVMSLNGKPALPILLQAFAIKNMDELKRRASEIFIGLCIPHSDQSDYTIRNLIGADFDQNCFSINDEIIEGNELFFCERNEKTAIEDMQRMLDKISRRLKQPPKGGLYISCLGRGREQFGKESEEIKMIHAKLGDFPLTGFFANGEIHHQKLYGYTGVLTLFL